MSKALVNLISCKPTDNFGQKGDRQLRNLVVSCQFGTTNSLFAITGSSSVFTANLTIPEKFWEEHDKDTEETISAYRKELEKALADGSFKLYGHIVSVSELTDGEHDSVYNKNTKHTITQFAQALDTDDADTAKSFIMRGLTRQIERKTFTWQTPED